MIYEQIASNKRKTVVILILFALIYIMVMSSAMYLMTGDVEISLLLGVIGSAIYLVIVYTTSGQRVLGMSQGQEADRDSYRQLYNVVEEVAIASGVKMPKVYVIPTGSPNAFASGMSEDDAVVGITTGLLEILNREELEGVIAHEMAHIKNQDMKLTTIVVALVASVVFVTQVGTRVRVRSSGNRNNSNGLFLIIALVSMLLGYYISRLVQLYLSRNREYLADATAAEITRNPDGLIRALYKIDKRIIDFNTYESGGLRFKAKQFTEEEDNQGDTNQSEFLPQDYDLADKYGVELDSRMEGMFFTNPFKTRETLDKDSIYSTHPSTANRIIKLKQSMGQTQ